MGQLEDATYVRSAVKLFALTTFVAFAVSVSCSLPAHCEDAMVTEPGGQQLQTSEKNLRIVSIKVRGNSQIPTEVILAHVDTKIGDKFDREKLQKDLRTIGNMGSFDPCSLRCDMELIPPNDVAVTISMQEKDLFGWFDRNTGKFNVPAFNETSWRIDDVGLRRSGRWGLWRRQPENRIPGYDRRRFSVVDAAGVVTTYALWIPGDSVDLDQFLNGPAQEYRGVDALRTSFGESI